MELLTVFLCLAVLVYAFVAKFAYNNYMRSKKEPKFEYVNPTQLQVGDYYVAEEYKLYSNSIFRYGHWNYNEFYGMVKWSDKWDFYCKQPIRKALMSEIESIEDKLNKDTDNDGNN